MGSSTSCLALTSLLALIATPRIADASCIPGFDYAVFTKSNINLENHMDTDSYNSASGSYASGGCSGNIGTNGTISMANNVTVCGTASTTGGAITVGNSASYTTPAQTISTVTLTNVTAPTGYPAGGSVNPGSGTTTAAPGKEYSTLGCSGNNTVLKLSAGTYVVGTMDFDHCDVQVTSGLVIIYLKAGGHFDAHNSARLNPPNTTGKPTDLVILSESTEDIHFYTSAIMYGGIYAPNSAIHFENQTYLYGAAVGKEFHGENHAGIHYDVAMGSLGAGAFACPAGEISRASPVVALLNGGNAHVVQGTYESPTGSQTSITSAATIATWSFPYLKGHMRARLASSISTSASSYSSGTIYFDAAATGKIPAANYTSCTSFNGTCRHVFTNTNGDAATGTTFHPSTTDLNDTTAATIGALIVPTLTTLTTANHQSIIHKILDAKLGGVDRSTVAVIEASQFAGLSTRPTMAYFGAADGMLHAVCAQSGGRTATYPSSDVCPSAGTELWAFIPRVQLPLIAGNTARVDGSVRVTDVFGDFTNNPATGTKSWHTILTFQTGFSVGSKGAVYAFDITDPASPTLLWEYTAPTTKTTTELGTGLTVAMAAPYIKGVLTNMVVAQTNNGGTGTAGVVAVALSQETGSRLWKFGDVYPTVPRGVAADGPLPASAVPGGAVGVDSTGENYVSDFVMGDIYGRIWQLRASDGVSKNGSGTPLFSFSSNRHPFGAPPAIFKRNGVLYAALASGGYADPTSTSWTNSTQYLIAAKLSYTSATTLTEATSATSTGPIGINTPLTSGDKGYSQVLVVGTQLFVTSDSSDTNLSTYGTSSSQTGHLATVDISTGSVGSAVLITTGATSLAYNSSANSLYSSSRNKQEQLAASPTNQNGGEKVDLESAPQMTRNLWLRGE